MLWPVIYGHGYLAACFSGCVFALLGMGWLLTCHLSSTLCQHIPCMAMLTSKIKLLFFPWNYWTWCTICILYMMCTWDTCGHRYTCAHTGYVCSTVQHCKGWDSRGIYFLDVSNAQNVATVLSAYAYGNWTFEPYCNVSSLENGYLHPVDNCIVSSPSWLSVVENFWTLNSVILPLWWGVACRLPCPLLLLF